MNVLFIVAASFFAALLGALGMGGGSVLILFLTAFQGAEQLTAQGINLFFFIPVALTALFLHRKNGLVRWRIAIPVTILGLVGVYFGVKLAMLLKPGQLSKLFGAFLLLIGIRELLARPPNDTSGKNR